LRLHICTTTLAHPTFEHPIFASRHVRSIIAQRHLRPYICALIIAFRDMSANNCTPTYAPRYLRPDICAPTFALYNCATTFALRHLRSYISALIIAPRHLRTRHTHLYTANSTFAHRNYWRAYIGAQY
jgi:hypothetical protein